MVHPVRRPVHRPRGTRSALEKITEHLVLWIRFLGGLLLLSSRVLSGSWLLRLLINHHGLHHVHHRLHLLKHSDLLSILIVGSALAHHLAHHLLHLKYLLLLRIHLILLLMHRCRGCDMRGGLRNWIVVCRWVLLLMKLLLLEFLLLLLHPLLLLLFEDEVGEGVFTQNCLPWDPWYEFGRLRLNWMNAWLRVCISR